MKITINTRVAALVAARNFMNEELKPILESLKDTNIALEDRWNAYIELVTNDILVNEENYGSGHIDILGDLTMYDDFNVDRHQTLTYPEMYERIMDEDAEKWYPRLFEARSNLSEWQEKVLSMGYSGFQYDW